MEDVNQLAEQVIGLAMKFHTALGCGLLESACEACLLSELRKHKVAHESQVDLPIVYDGVQIGTGYRQDRLIPNQLIIELKSVAVITDIHEAQLLS